VSFGVAAAALLELAAGGAAEGLCRAGRAALESRDGAAIRRAAEGFELAAALAPGRACAPAGLATAHALLFDYPRSEVAARAALALDDGNAEACAALGFARLHGAWDRAGARADLDRAVELAPGSARARLWLAIALEVAGETERAVAEARRAAALEPESPVYAAALGHRLFWARRYDEAIAQLERAHALDPSRPTARYFQGRALVQLGDLEGARRSFSRAAEISPGDANLLSAIALLDALAGRRRAALAALAELERLHARGYPFASQIAGVLVALGERARALAWLERALTTREGPLLWLAVDPRFDALRGEERFRELASAAGFGDAARAGR
jgi:tetratricopeptide (TPR) repeat protein